MEIWRKKRIKREKVQGSVKMGMAENREQNRSNTYCEKLFFFLSQSDIILIEFLLDKFLNISHNWILELFFLKIYS